MFFSLLPGLTTFIFVGVIIILLYKLFPIVNHKKNRSKHKKA